MSKKYYSLVWASVLMICFVATVAADVRIKVSKRKTMPGMPAPFRHPQTGETRDPSRLPDSTVLVKNARMRTDVRTEVPSMTNGFKKIVMTTIKQCDLGRQVMFTNDKKHYSVMPFGGASGAPSAAPKNSTDKRGGVVKASITFTDTGERQQMFGLTARRVKSVMVLTPGPDASCTKAAFRRESDGWYVDLPGHSCPLEFAQPEHIGDGQSCSDVFELQTTGKPETGFAVKETMTLTMDGQPPITITSEATELAQTELDDVLFDVPEGYEENRTSAQNGGDTQTRGLGLTQNVPPVTDASAVAQVASETPHAAGPTPVLGPKQPGVVRFGVARPEVQTPDSKSDPSAGDEMASAARAGLMAALKKESWIEVVALTSRQPEQEANEKGCDYILYSKVTQKRGGGGLFGNTMAMSALGMATSMLIPGVGGMVAGAITNIAMSQTMGKAAKPKDEFSLEYRAITPDNMTLIQGAGQKAKVSKPGEDVLTPQLEKAAATIAAEAKKKLSSKIEG